MAALARGEFRVSDRPGKDGKHRLTGVRPDGKRISMPVDSLTEGHTLGQTIFRGVKHQTLPTLSVTTPGNAPEQLDDFGVPVGFRLPKVSAETVATMAPPAQAQQQAAPAAGKDVQRTKNAETLAELLGVGVATGVGLGSTHFLEKRYEVVPKPSKKHLQDLASNVTKGIKDLWGDKEVGPWTMAFLLILGIPIAMWIQSDKPKKQEEPTERQPLQSVP